MVCWPSHEAGSCSSGPLDVAILGILAMRYFSYHGGRWKCWEVALHAGGSHRMWIGLCVLMNLGASSGQIRVIPISTAEGPEVGIHIFRTIDIGMLILLAFLILSEHLVSMLAFFGIYSCNTWWWVGKRLKRSVNIAELSISFFTYTELLFWNLHCLCFIICYAEVLSVHVVTCWEISMRYV